MLFASLGKHTGMQFPQPNKTVTCPPGQNVQVLIFSSAVQMTGVGGQFRLGKD